MENMVQAGFRQQQKVIRDLRIFVSGFDEAGSPHFDLTLRLLPGNIKQLMILSNVHSHLQQEGGFPDTGITTDQDHGTGNDPTAQHLRKLRNAGFDAGFSLFIDIFEPLRSRICQTAGTDTCSAACRKSLQFFFELFHHGAIRTTARASS